MRLEKLRQLLSERSDILYEYHEEDGLGSIDIQFRGIKYHVWEFEEDGVYGAETNVYNCARSQDLTGDYEEEIISVIKTWPAMTTKG